MYSIEKRTCCPGKETCVPQELTALVEELGKFVGRFLRKALHLVYVVSQSVCHLYITKCYLWTRRSNTKSKQRIGIVAHKVETAKHVGRESIHVSDALVRRTHDDAALRTAAIHL